ncbi:MAG: prenyltransferase/squalene oxidase repeat-containing protein [Planctomycetales bacterium]
MSRVSFLTLFSLCSLIAAVRADDPGQVNDPAVRDAVSRSLPFLEKEGVAWMEDHGCMSCHHVPFLLWSHRSAQAQGFMVDSRKLAEWDEWTRKDSLANRNLFTLRPYDLGRPEAASLPLAVKDKLKPLVARPFQTEAAFLAELTPLLTEDEMQSHRATVLQISERPVAIFDRVGGGLEALGPLLIASQGTASVLTRPEFRDGVIDLLSQIQLTDGSWTPGGQFSGMRRWTHPTANQATTMWTTLALASYDTPDAKRSASIQKAIAYQRLQAPNPDNREWLAMRLLFERQFGSAEDVAKLRQQLLNSRNGDGAWGWEKGVPSDPLTTSLAIYVLAKARAGDDSSVFRDARQWLLASQQSDGSWLTPAKNFTNSTDPERLRVRDEIYHYWGTAWAVIGLLETLGKSGS